MWNEKDANIMVERNSERIIQCLWQNDCGQKMGNIVACYRMHYLARKKNFWINLENIFYDLMGPWLLVGDLNKIISR